GNHWSLCMHGTYCHVVKRIPRAGWRLITPVPTEKVDDSALEVVTSHPAPLTMLPVLLDGQRHLALLDRGASCSLIGAKLADDLGKVIESQEGVIQLAEPSKTMPRIGITSPIRVQVGPLDILYRCEVISQLPDAQFLIGSDLIQRLGLDRC